MGSTTLNIPDDEEVDNTSVADLPANSSTEAVSVSSARSETSSPAPIVLSLDSENSITASDRKNEFKSTPVLEDNMQGSNSLSENSRKRKTEDQPSTSAGPLSDEIATSRPRRTPKHVYRPDMISWDHISISGSTSSSGGSHADVIPLSRSSGRLPSGSLPSSSSSSSSSSSNRDDEEMDMRPAQRNNRTRFTSGISGSNRNETLISLENEAPRARTLRSWNPAKFAFSNLLSSSSVPSTSSSSNSALNCPSTSTTSSLTKTTVFDDGTGGYIINSKPLGNSDVEAPIMVLECRNAEDWTQYINERRIKLVNEYKWELPNVCNAAKSGSEDGSWDRKIPFPGNPNKKYSEEDYLRFGDRVGYWTVQSLFTRGDDPSRITVLYEGWTPVFDHVVEDIRAAAPEAFEVFLIRDNFLKEVVKFGPDWAKGVNEEQRVVQNGKQLQFTNLESPFWICQDLSYFHTVLHKQHKLAPIFFIGLEKLKSPPKFLYTAVNVLKARTYRRLKDMSENNSFAVLNRRNARDTSRSAQNGDRGSCENNKHCVCNRRFQLLYSDASQYLQQDANGKLDFSNFDSSRSRIVVECSDECGCSASCPRRALQRGQQTPLVIFLEGEAGWGVRAAGDIEKGSLVCEYTGQAYYKPEEEEDVNPKKMKIRDEDVVHPTKSTSYECEFTVMNPNFILCAEKIGNVARFLQHSCDPSCVFVETHSRELATDLLIPRVSVYALRDIKVGEAVTISYWGDVSKLNFTPSSTRCRCGSDKTKCIKHLPSKLL